MSARLAQKAASEVIVISFRRNLIAPERIAQTLVRGDNDALVRAIAGLRRKGGIRRERERLQNKQTGEDPHDDRAP